MGININDLDNNLNPVGASLLSGNETVLDNLRELSDEELKTCGGGKKGGENIVVTGGGFGGETVVVGGGGKKGGQNIVVTGNGFGGFGSRTVAINGSSTVVTGGGFGYGSPTVVTT